MLNVNALAEGRDYTRVGTFENSPNHRLIAYGVDFDGSEQFTVHVLDLETGETLPDVIPNTYYSLEWANDSRTLYYSVLDEHHRPVSVYRHTLGNDPGDDELVYHEEDPRFFVGVGKSNSGRFVYIVAGGNNMSEWRFVDADDPDAPTKLIEPRATDFEYDVVDHGDRFFIRHNGNGARDFMLSTAPVATPSWDNWTQFMAHQPGRPIQGIDAYREHLVVGCRSDGLPQVMVLRLVDGTFTTWRVLMRTISPCRPVAAASLTQRPCGFVHVAANAGGSVRLRHGEPGAGAAQATGDTLRLRLRAIRNAAHLGHGKGWHDGSDQPADATRHFGGRQRAPLPVRIRQLRFDHGSQFQHLCAQPGQPRFHLRHRPHPGRHGNGLGLV